MSVKKGCLYLIPVSLSDHRPEEQAPLTVKEIVCGLRHYLAEDSKTARAWLRKIDPSFPLQATSIHTLDEHTKSSDIPELLMPALHGEDMGLVSEAGCPAIADPGANLVAAAHGLDIPVMPLIGPSAIMMGLMSSGLNGQCFAFCGYLPQQTQQREKRLRELEQRSRRNGETQIFIEAPYRNTALLGSLLSACMASTRLTLAVDLTAPSQYIMTRTVSDWRKQIPDLHKRPTVFLILAVT
jgi:16S rRNA (cytidine1402-2'-O)-methyltransferase